MSTLLDSSFYRKQLTKLQPDEGLGEAIFWTRKGLPVPGDAAVLEPSANYSTYRIWAAGRPASRIRDLTAALESQASDSRVLAALLPHGFSVEYGWDVCETCGVNTDAVTWFFHGNDSVSFEAQFGCFTGASGGPVSFTNALDALPTMGGTHEVLDPDDPELDDVSEGPELNFHHLHTLWCQHRRILERLRALDTTQLHEWARFLAAYQQAHPHD